MDSARVAPLHTKTPEPPKRKAQDAAVKKEADSADTYDHSKDETSNASIEDIEQNERSKSVAHSRAEMIDPLTHAGRLAMPEASENEKPDNYLKDAKKWMASTPKKALTSVNCKEGAMLKSRPNAVTDESSPAYSPKEVSRSRESKKPSNGFKPTIPRKKVQPPKASDGSPSNGGTRIPRKVRRSKDQGLTMLMQQGMKVAAQRQDNVYPFSGQRPRGSPRPLSKSLGHSTSPRKSELDSRCNYLAKSSLGGASIRNVDDQRSYSRRSTPSSKGFEKDRDGNSRDFRERKSPPKRSIESPSGESNPSRPDSFVISRRGSPKRWRRTEYDNELDRDHRSGRESGNGYRSKSPSVGKARRHNHYDDHRSYGRYDDERANHRYQDSRGFDGDYYSRTRRSADSKYSSTRDSPSSRVQTQERYRHRDETSRPDPNGHGGRRYYDEYPYKGRYAVDYEIPPRSECGDDEKYARSRDDNHIPSRRDSDRKHDREHHPKRSHDRDYDRDYVQSYDRGGRDSDRDYHRPSRDDYYYEYDKPRQSRERFGRHESPKHDRYAERDWGQRK